MPHANPDATVRVVSENPDAEVTIVGGQVIEATPADVGKVVKVDATGDLVLATQGAGTGTVDSVVPTAPITVDATDPANPIVALTTGTDPTDVPLNSDLPTPAPSTDIIPDVISSPGDLLYDLAATIHPDAVEFAAHAKITSVRLATVAALPASTYAAGASGVGATLTGDANGALAAIDYVTPVAGDRILVKTQAAPLQNGIYTVTTLGTGGTPFVLTRVAEADEAADYAKSIFVLVADGRTNRATIWRSEPTTVTMGTTGIRWLPPARSNASPADSAMGPARDRVRYHTDFEEIDATLTVAGGGEQRLPGTPWTFRFSGTGSQAAQVGPADATRGAAGLSTGTTTTGYAAAISSVLGFIFSSSLPYAFYAKAKTPTLTSAADLFVVRLGSIVDFIGTPTAGIYFEAANDGGNWDAVCMAGSVETRVDTGVSQTTGYKQFNIFYDPDTGAATFYIANVLVATITTNLPSVVLVTGGVIIKQGGSTGTTARLLHLDLVTVDHRDDRSNSPLIP